MQPSAAASGQPAIRTAPSFFEFSAPATWRAIDFISDLHLCQEMPATFKAWSAHLHQTPADAVFILGDLFEVWVGDDAMGLDFEQRCIETLAEVASRRHLAFMVGNRDFLVGRATLEASGMMGLPDPTLLHAWGRSVLLSHGDALCLDDHPYQRFRNEVRGLAWQANFLGQTLAERQRLAAVMRSASASAQRRQFDGDSRVDIDTSEAVRWMHAIGAQEMVHGHTHQPGSAALAPGFKRHVLSDWDLDHAQRAEVLRLTRDGFQRLPPDSD